MKIGIQVKRVMDKKTCKHGKLVSKFCVLCRDDHETEESNRAYEEHF